MFQGVGGVAKPVAGLLLLYLSSELVIFPETSNSHISIYVLLPSSLVTDTYTLISLSSASSLSTNTYIQIPWRHLSKPSHFLFLFVKDPSRNWRLLSPCIATTKLSNESQFWGRQARSFSRWSANHMHRGAGVVQSKTLLALTSLTCGKFRTVL